MVVGGVFSSATFAFAACKAAKLFVDWMEIQSTLKENKNQLGKIRYDHRRGHLFKKTAREAQMPLKCQKNKCVSNVYCCACISLSKTTLECVQLQDEFIQNQKLRDFFFLVFP